MTDFEHFEKDCRSVRKNCPLVVCITNYVAMNVTANALLAIGASPVMSFSTKEIEELVKKCSALLVNLGCLDSHQNEAIKIAVTCAVKNGIPWVLDPVGAGLTRYRRENAALLVKEYNPSVIRGNAAEILALSDGNYYSDGLDARDADRERAVEAAREIARKKRCVVSLSGSTDFITDGKQVATVSNGSPLMSRTTAMGCTAGAVTAAFAAVDQNTFEAASNAMALMGTAGELAASMSHGTGSFQTNFLDVLSEGSPEELAKLIRK